MKRVSLICCTILCVVSVAGASALGIQTQNARSTETILPAEAYDAAQAAYEMEVLHQRLLAARAENQIVDLGELTRQEAERLSDDQVTDTRRYLVGVDRPVAATIDLATSAGKGGAIGAVHTLIDGTMVVPQRIPLPI